MVVGGHRGRRRRRRADDAAHDAEAGHVQSAVARRRRVGRDVVLVARRHAVLLDAVGPAFAEEAAEASCIGCLTVPFLSKGAWGAR